MFSWVSISASRDSARVPGAIVGAGAIADLGGTNLVDVDDLDRLDGIRNVPVQTGTDRLLILSETQHHTLAAFGDDVETGQSPQGNDDEQYGAYAERCRPSATTFAAGARRTAPSAAEQAAELLLQLAHDLIEIRRSLLLPVVVPAAPRILAAPGAARFVQAIPAPVFSVQRFMFLKLLIHRSPFRVPAGSRSDKTTIGIDGLEFAAFQTEISRMTGVGASIIHSPCSLVCSCLTAFHA